MAKICALVEGGGVADVRAFFVAPAARGGAGGGGTVLVGIAAAVRTAGSRCVGAAGGGSSDETVAAIVAVLCKAPDEAPSFSSSSSISQLLYQISSESTNMGSNMPCSGAPGVTDMRAFQQQLSIPRVYALQ